MGRYLNPRNSKYRTADNSEIHVDKSGLIVELEKMFGTERRFVAVGQPGCFGKSMAVNMMAHDKGAKEDVCAIERIEMEAR